MNRPRKSNRKHWPDYLNARKKPGGMYYSWKHPHTGKEYGLGYSFQTAAVEVREAHHLTNNENHARQALRCS